MDLHLDFGNWIREHTAPPARLLEVGCGDGELARKLSQDGFEVTAIDPEAPTGDIFETTSLEEFTSTSPFDVVVASRSLHHIADLSEALKKIHSLLVPRGLLVINEFAWDQMDERTARWYLSQATEHRHEDESLVPGRFPDAWIEEHDGLHDSETLRRAFGELFDERIFDWIPYVTEHYLKRPDLIAHEKDLIQSDSVSPLGFRYVGIARSTA